MINIMNNSDSPILTRTLTELRRGITQGEYSADELSAFYRARINAHNPKINAVLTEAPAFTHISSGKFSGVPIIHKDVFCTHNLRTTAGSKILENFIPPYSAHIVECLQNTGMVTIGKANMDEFAMGSTNENSAYGACKNPWSLDHSPGGSSGGSAASVAAGFTPIATGSDTGGSIRTPASHCGVTGIKPSYGMVSRYGMIAYASSLDQAGVFARHAEDCAEVLQMMSNFDTRDSTQVPINARPKTLLTEALNHSLQGKKMGVPHALFERCLPSQRHTLMASIQSLQAMGVSVVDIDFPPLDTALAAYYIIATAEASSNLSRFDGIRYGHRTQHAENLEQVYAKSRVEAFGEEVKRRILLGTFVLSHGYYDAYYLSALKIRRLVANQFRDIFKLCDFLALPVSPTPAPKLGIKLNPVDDYWLDVFTVPINLAGLPALSMPVGMVSEEGINLPVGLQLTAPYFGEGLLLNVAHQYQQQTRHHLNLPKLGE